MDNGFKNIRLYIADLDGTLYVGNRPVPGAAEKIREITDKGKQVCYLTNNSSKSKSEYTEKLAALGFPLKGAGLMTSGVCAAEYIKYNYPGRRVYVLGTDGLRQEFASRGLDVIPFSENERLLYACSTEKSEIIAVLGFDTGLKYENLNVLCGLIADGAEYIATNPDTHCPAPYGRMPDAGTMMALIEKFSGRLPDAVCGKPFSIMGDAVRRLYGYGESETAMIGDNLMTDIRFAENSGFKSALVLTGNTSRGLLENSRIKPDIVLNSIADLEI